MEAGLTADTFTTLLNRLDADRERAGEKYEDLRRTLMRFFEWRGAPFPEEHADEAFNRVARRLGEGVEIKNISGYCYEVARLVFLETIKGSKKVSLEAMNLDPAAAADMAGEIAEKELRMGCLDECLSGLPAESVELILEYYSYEERGQSSAAGHLRIVSVCGATRWLTAHNACATTRELCYSVSQEEIGDMNARICH